MYSSLKKSLKATAYTSSICAVLLSGCSNSTNSTDTDTSVPSTSPSSQILADQVASDSSLDVSVSSIQEAVNSRSLNALETLNQAYISGTLAASRIDCVDQVSGFPVLEYYCGEGGVGERLDDFGYPAFALSVVDNNECRNSMVNDSSADACTLAYSESELAGEWFVKYALNVINGVNLVELTLSDGVVPQFVQAEGSNAPCEIQIIGSTVVGYNDEPTCRVAIAQVLAILQAP